MNETNILTNEQFAIAIDAIIKNQNVINDKVNSLLEINSKLLIENNDIKEVINKQTSAIYHMDNILQGITSKLADMQIQQQNSNSDTDNITNSISELSAHVDGLRQKLDQWKIYSEL